MNKIFILLIFFCFFSLTAMEEKADNQNTQPSSTSPKRKPRWINNFSPLEKQIYRTRKAQAAQASEKYKSYF